MKPLSFMLIAGEASGDALAAELVSSLRTLVISDEGRPTDDAQPLKTALAPRFFGAGGPHMAAAGVELAFDLTRHSVIGVFGVLKKYPEFRRMFRQLFKLAIDRQPDVIIGVDYGGFNLRFARAIKNYVRKHSGEFVNWNPKIVQFVSPQVWASRPGRADSMAGSHDLVLSLFPFEKQWYARRTPRLRVEFVGHPMMERFSNLDLRFTSGLVSGRSEATRPAQVVLLPGSRTGELRRHLPVMREALNLIQQKHPALIAKIILPNQAIMQQARVIGVPANVEIQVGNLPEALNQADLAIASTGTVTMECAYFGVPTVTLYRMSVVEFEIARRIATLTWATMPNILANEELYPEFIQNAATPENLARAALGFLDDPERRQAVKIKLSRVVASLGGPGATTRAARAILSLLP